MPGATDSVSRATHFEVTVARAGNTIFFVKDLKDDSFVADGIAWTVQSSYVFGWSSVEGPYEYIGAMADTDSALANSFAV